MGIVLILKDEGFVCKGRGMKKERNSNIELLRIVLMMGILISHFYPITLDENYVYYGASYIWFLGDFLGWTMTGFGKVGVMIFVLISGYFLCDMTFSKQKLYKFLFQCYFWNLIMLFVGLFVLKYSLKPSIIYEGLFPLTPNNWFARTYLMLYVSFPYINKWIVNRYNKKILRNIVLIGIGLLMVLPMLFRIAQGGYLNSYLVFILLYLVGAYLKRYPPKDEFLMKIGGCV